MMMLEFSIFPVGSGESLSRAVAGAIKLVQESGLKYEICEMGTTVEGSTGDCLRLVERCVDQMAKEYDRLSCYVKMDYRKGKRVRLGTKAKKVKGLAKTMKK